MAENSVLVQLQKAIEMKETTLAFSAILDARMSDLKDMLNYYISAGFPSDIANTYRNNYLYPDDEVISELSTRMKTEHVDFLDNVIDDLTIASTRN